MTQIFSATAYGGYAAPDAIIPLAQQAGLNTLELVEFQTQYHTLSDAMSEATWTRVDAFIAACAKAGLKVILHLAEYGQSRVKAGQPPLDIPSWRTYLTFVANRVNTVTKLHYGDDPTILLLQLWGEIPKPATLGVSTAQMTQWFSAMFAAWKSMSIIPIGSGGFSYLNDPNSGIDWKAIIGDANCALGAVELNSFDDWKVSVPLVSAYCKQIGKPWFLSAWSACIGPSSGAWDCNHYADDVGRAQHVANMIWLADGASPAACPSVGYSFWNLGRGTGNTCDLNPTFAASWAALQQANVRRQRAVEAVWNTLKIVRGNDTPAPLPGDAFVADLMRGATLGAVVNAIFASGEGQAALGKPI